MMGLLVRSAERGVPAVLDGVIATAAAVLAEFSAPESSRWWIAGHRSAEPAHAMALNYLGKEPVLDLGMRLGEGTGALAAVPILQGAIAVAADMATFASARVAEGG